MIARVLVAILLSVAPAAAQLIPASRLAQANWECAGMRCEGGIPARSTICATFAAATYGNGASDAAAAIRTAVTTCPVGQVISLGAGLFRFDTAVLVDRGITIRGAGAGVTTIRNVNGSTRDTGNLDTANGNVAMGGRDWRDKDRHTPRVCALPGRHADGHRGPVLGHRAEAPHSGRGIGTTGATVLAS